MEYDVIVVGARIAGSLTATLLAEAGHRVLLLDRSRFSSDTLSTYFFTAPALRTCKFSRDFQPMTWETWQGRG